MAVSGRDLSMDPDHVHIGRQSAQKQAAKAVDCVPESGQ